MRICQPGRLFQRISRREFFRNTTLAGVGVSLLPQSVRAASDAVEQSPQSLRLPRQSRPSPALLDLSPARWIWYPSERTLANTVLLFRKAVVLPAVPEKASGWIVADSRYRLFVNGARVQWGPAPSDPRWTEADPIDLTALLRPGENVIGAEVLYYGHGDGTWPMGKPGFLFTLDITGREGPGQRILSDSSWQVRIPRCWRPGQYKRWYLRSFQEEFDARFYPQGWCSPGFVLDDTWSPAMELQCPAFKPAICSSYPDYALDLYGSTEECELRTRRIPLLRESMVPVQRLVESYHLEWKRPPQEYFESVTPNAFIATPFGVPSGEDGRSWVVRLEESRASALTFEFQEQIVGWPLFTIEAPEGTVVEMLVHEAHQPGGPVLLNTHFHSWTRFVCREGVNSFEPFDFESFRWLQLHIHGARGRIVIRDVAARRRIYPWPHLPAVRCSEPLLQRLMDASVNTLHNSAQETVVDGMARERQQYSGDGAHQLHALHLAFGETRLPTRFLTTFSQGMTLDGFFLDCWPAYDRLARLMERQLQVTVWGPLLDHGVGFCFDCWHHYMYTGDLDALREPYPRLLRFVQYLSGILGSDRLLPVENIGVPTVWIDHDAFRKQRHKQCSFNLYTAAMLRSALAPLCRAFGDREWEGAVLRMSDELLKAAVGAFWDSDRSVFVDNAPWRGEEQEVRLSDRTLATALLYDLCPGGVTEPSVRALADLPPEVGFSYPANAGWRLWALGRAGRTDVVVNDLRRRWATMDSVRLNNTLAESWRATPDSFEQWSHCAVVPLYVLFMTIAGIAPLQAGFERYEVVPQPADLDDLALTAYTPRGPLSLQTRGARGARTIVVTAPASGDGELVLDVREQVGLEPRGGEQMVLGRRCRRYVLPRGRQVTVDLRYT